jgi:hypothetical protein
MGPERQTISTGTQLLINGAARAADQLMICWRSRSWHRKINGLITRYADDPDTFRLVRLRTEARPAERPLTRMNPGQGPLL